MNKKLYKQTLAFAGVIQAAALVQRLAMEGKVPEEAFRGSIHSLYEQNPSSIVDVFGSEEGIRFGLEQLTVIFNTKSKKMYRDLSRYIVSIFHLASKLTKSPELMKKLEGRVNLAKNQAQYFHDMHPNVIGSFAQAYLDTASTYQFRIQVIGKKEFMQRPDTMDKVRALLLAGVRSAILWKQVGGTHWHLLFRRRPMIKTAEELLK